MEQYVYVDFNSEIERAIAQGKENLEFYQLIENHCAKARIERMPGRGMIEQQTGLPIGHFSLACEHSKGSGYAAYRLSQVAVDFYRENCVGCAHRDPKNIPNLASFVEQLDAAAAKEREQEEAAQLKQEAIRQSRRVSRTKAATNLDESSRKIVSLINNLDSDSPNREQSKELEILVRAKLNDLSLEVIDLIVSAAEEIASDSILPTVLTILKAGRVPYNKIESLAVEAVFTRRSKIGLKVILGGPEEESLVSLEQLVSQIIQVRFQPEHPFANYRKDLVSGCPWDRAFTLLLTHRTGLLLETVDKMLQSKSSWDRLAAAVAAGVIGSNTPEAIPVLTQQLISSLKSLADIEPHSGIYDNPASRMADSIGDFMILLPKVVSSIVEDRAMSLTADQRKELFRSYGEACRKVKQDAGLELKSTLFSVCVRRLGGDWGNHVVIYAESAIESLISDAPETLSGKTDTLLALLLSVSEEQGVSPPQTLADQLEVMNMRTSRTVAMRAVTKCLELQAKREPEAVFNALEAILANREIRNDATRRIRRTCIDLLSALIDSPFFSKVLPILYTCLLGTDQVERAAAATAFGKISQRYENLPPEVSGSMPLLLSDDYVIVHKAATRAIFEGLRIRDGDRRQVCIILVNLCSYYLKQPDEGPFVLDVFRALNAVWTPEMGLENVGVEFHEIILRLAKELSGYDLRTFVQICSYRYRETTGYVEAILRILEGDPNQVDPNDSYTDYREKLTELAPALVSPYRNKLAKLALAHAPKRLGPAIFYVEYLQNLGFWAEASSLANEILAMTPTTYEFTGRRRTAQEIAGQAKLELAIHTQEPDSVTVAVEELSQLDATPLERPDTCERELQDADVRRLRTQLPDLLAKSDFDSLRKVSHELDDLITEDWAPTTLVRWRVFSKALLVVSNLLEWVDGVRNAAADSMRFLSAAKLIAHETIDDPKHLELQPKIGEFLKSVKTLSEPQEVTGAASTLQCIALPIPFSRRRHLARPSFGEEAPKAPKLYAVSELYLDESPASDSSLVRLNRAYSVKISLRLSDWPEEFGSLDARFLRVNNFISVDDFQFKRPASSDADGFWTVTGVGTLVISAARALGSDPLTLTLSLDFHNSTNSPKVLGQGELRLWSFDENHDHFTGVEQLDKRVADIAHEISTDSALGDESCRRDFINFLIAVTRAGVVMQRNDPFMVGDDIGEADFQKELLKLLQMDPVLRGLVHEGSEVSGGETDLLYKKIVGELKVEKTNPVTEKNVSKYLGQTTSYASGLGSQLGVACILDLSAK